MKERSEEMQKLKESFEHTATEITKILVKEESFEEGQKSIKSLDNKGVMGGEKYLVCNIFFKFARDTRGMFGNNHQHAAKSALNELRNANAIITAKIPNLHVLLSAVIKYRGRCVVAVAKAPIHKESLVYGSGDAKNTIQNKSPVMKEMMEKLAKYYNLKQHRLQDMSKHEEKLWMAGDVEGHQGNDGRF